MKIIVPLAAFGVFIVVAVYAVFHTGIFDTPVQATTTYPETEQTEEATSTAESSVIVKSEWEFKFIEDGVSDVLEPQTDVGISFRVESESRTEGPYRLGSFTGSCSEQTPQEGEIAHALCWYAGFGTEFSVIQEGRRLQVLNREVDEGSVEIVSEPTEYTTVLTVTL